MEGALKDPFVRVDRIEPMSEADIESCNRDLEREGLIERASNDWVVVWCSNDESYAQSEGVLALQLPASGLKVGDILDAWERHPTGDEIPGLPEPGSGLDVDLESLGPPIYWALGVDIEQLDGSKRLVGPTHQPLRTHLFSVSDGPVLSARTRAIGHGEDGAKFLIQAADGHIMLGVLGKKFRTQAFVPATISAEFAVASTGAVRSMIMNMANILRGPTERLEFWLADDNSLCVVVDDEIVDSSLVESIQEQAAFSGGNYLTNDAIGTTYRLRLSSGVNLGTEWIYGARRNASRWFTLMINDQNRLEIAVLGADEPLATVQGPGFLVDGGLRGIRFPMPHAALLFIHGGVQSGDTIDVAMDGRYGFALLNETGVEAYWDLPSHHGDGPG